MSSRPRLLSLDAFSKTIEDAKIKTTSGGIITLVCVAIVLFLIRNEYNDYTLLITLPTLVVDKDINKPLDINLDITFPNLPCEVITLDILDVSGDARVDILKSGFQKMRILHNDNGREVLDDGKMLYDTSLEELATAGPGADGACGSCYGALPQEPGADGKVKYCCNDCATVRVAYAEKMWAFYDGANIEQCEKEGYVSRLTERINSNEGCRIKGTTKINRISGNLHFAPGASSTQPGRHSHDLSLYTKYTDKFNFDHIINSLLFGPTVDKIVGDEEISTHPLDNFQQFLAKKDHLFSYYIKVVASRFEYMNKPTLDTNQFLVITHDRPLAGGRDDDHQHTLHARGGMPGVFLFFDISPMKIINKEQYAKTWSGFVLGVISSIAGVLMFGTLLDRSVFAAEQVIRLKKDL